MRRARPAPSESPFYTPGQVARLFQRTTRTIRAWPDQNLITRVKVGTATYYRRSEIDALLSSGEEENFKLSGN